MMRLLTLSLLLASAMIFPLAAHATSANAPKSGWMEILPTKQTSDPKAVAIAEVLLAEEIKLYVDRKQNFFLAARFFNMPKQPQNTFIIAKFEGTNYCGIMGCMTYFLKKTDLQKNVWKIAETNNFNSIVTSDALLARQPSFYTKGTEGSPYRRYNTATEKYETRR